jgi:NitT/TauT family transport system ATP-binding protein
MTPRPGRISAEFVIEETERSEEFRTSAAYAAHCRDVSQALARSGAPRANP